jgi:hypothetical protein
MWKLSKMISTPTILTTIFPNLSNPWCRSWPAATNNNSNNNMTFKIWIMIISVFLLILIAGLGREWNDQLVRHLLFVLAVAAFSSALRSEVPKTEMRLFTNYRIWLQVISTLFFNYSYYSVAWVQVRTVPTERPPLVGEVTVNFLWIEGTTWSAWRIPTVVFSAF